MLETIFDRMVSWSTLFINISLYVPLTSCNLINSNLIMVANEVQLSCHQNKTGDALETADSG